MRNIISVLAIFIVLGGCANRKNSNNIVEKDSLNQSLSKADGDRFKVDKEKSNIEDVPDFLKISKNRKTASLGFLQGVEKSDSSGPYVIKEYFSDTLTFDLLFFPKSGNKEEVNFSSINSGAANNYQDYICFAFVYPMQDPDKMKDYHADNVIYPVNVKVYVRKTNNWEFLSQMKVKSLRGLSKYEIKSIYSIVH